MGKTMGRECLDVDLLLLRQEVEEVKEEEDDEDVDVVTLSREKVLRFQPLVKRSFPELLSLSQCEPDALHQHAFRVQKGAQEVT